MADKKTTMGIVINAASSRNENEKENVTNIADEAKSLSNVTLATVENKSKWKNYGSSVYFRRLLDTTGKEISTDLDYARYSSHYKQFLRNEYFDAAENSIAKPDSLLGSLPQDITIYSGRVDYLHPLKKGSKFEMGLKSSIVRTGNDAQYDSIQNGTIVHDVLRSNHFVYEENINAAYVNWSGKLNKKLEAQFGLRLENTQAKGKQLTTGENFDKSYTHLFPTAYFQYKINTNNSLGLNYGKRIRRPNYSSLNPFIRFIDRYTYSKGNPDLKPQFSHNIEVSHSYKNKITTTFNYGYTNDIIQQVLEQKGQEAYTTLANIATMHQFGLAVNASNNIRKWWTSNIYVNVFYNRLEGIVNQGALLISGARFMINGSQQFKISKTFTGELSGMYRSGGVMGVLRTQSIWQLSAGFNKQVMKNNGSIRFTVRDIFYTLNKRAAANYGNVDVNFQEREDSRVVSLGFTYKFSKGKNGGPKKRGAGTIEELGRVGMD
jgi:iron complex outermembrane recepter protein